MATKRTLPDFATSLRVRAAYVTKNSDNLVRKTTRAVVHELIESTPVDTGRARTNWRTLYYTPTEVLYDKPDQPPSVTDAMDRAYLELEDTIQYYTGRRSIYITNNTPYLGMLNEGSSPQQRNPGYIDRAILRGHLTIKQAQPLLAKPVRTDIGQTSSGPPPQGYGRKPSED